MNPPEGYPVATVFRAVLMETSRKTLERCSPAVPNDAVLRRIMNSDDYELDNSGTCYMPFCIYPRSSFIAELDPLYKDEEGRLLLQALGKYNEVSTVWAAWNSWLSWDQNAMPAVLGSVLVCVFSDRFVGEQSALLSRTTHLDTVLHWIALRILDRPSWVRTIVDRKPITVSVAALERMQQVPQKVPRMR